jgi:hypothetical protein
VEVLLHTYSVALLRRAVEEDHERLVALATVDREHAWLVSFRKTRVLLSQCAKPLEIDAALAES